MFAGEIARFEQWFMEKQRGGPLEPTPLIGPEHAILRAFMFYVHSKEAG